MTWTSHLEHDSTEAFEKNVFGCLRRLPQLRALRDLLQVGQLRPQQVPDGAELTAEDDHRLEEPAAGGKVEAIGNVLLEDKVVGLRPSFSSLISS